MTVRCSLGGVPTLDGNNGPISACEDQLGGYRLAEERLHFPSRCMLEAEPSKLVEEPLDRVAPIARRDSLVIRQGTV